MTEKEDQSIPPEYEPFVISSVSEEVRSCWLDASDMLEPIEDLCEVLDDKMDLLEELEGQEGSDAALMYEIRIARTVMGLLAEKARKLNRRANYSKDNLETKLRVMKLKLADRGQTE
jgi:hypothetical protein